MDNRTKTSSVYLLWAEGTTRFKIGYTSGSVDDRASVIQAYSPFPLRIVGEMPGTMQLERYLHNWLRSFRRHGEWFDLPESAVWAVLKRFGCNVPQGV